MKKLLITSLLLLCPILVFAQSTEQINPNDPNYSVELNDILQSLTTNTNSLSLQVQANTAITGGFTNGILQPANGGTGYSSVNWPAGSIVGMASTGAWGYLTPGTSGYFLESQGAEASPTYVPNPSPWTLISTTPVSSNSSSGAITLTSNLYYKVIVLATGNAVPNNGFYIIFNNDGTSNYSYAYTGQGSGNVSPFVGNGTGDQIFTGPVPTASSPISMNFDLTPVLSNADDEAVYGNVFGNYAKGYADSVFSGFYIGSSTITSFAVLNTAPWSGTVYLYQMIL